MADQDAPDELAEPRRRAYGRGGTAEDRRRLAELEAQEAYRATEAVRSSEEPIVEPEESAGPESEPETVPERSRGRRALIPAVTAVIGLGIGLAVAPTIGALGPASPEPTPTSTLPTTSWRDPLLIFNRDSEPRDAEAPPFLGMQLWTPIGAG